MKQWFYAQFSFQQEIVEFANKHNLPPGHIVPLANSIIPAIGMINVTHVMYYSDKELEP